MTDHVVLVRPDDTANSMPDHPAVVDAGSGVVVTYAELVTRSIQIARWLHDRGLRPGDHVAFLMSNIPQYFEVVWAARRSGLYYTPINWHLMVGEIRYLLENSGARALIVSADLVDVADEAVGDTDVATKLVVGGERKGWDSYETVVSATPADSPGLEIEGQAMLYSSGTTGMPKGIVHDEVELDRIFGDIRDDIIWRNVFGYTSDSVSLVAGPLYHAAPLVSAMQIHRRGGTVVLMRRFDAEEVLAGIERYKVNFAQFVPTMFVRMLRLPDSTRMCYDLSSLQIVAHSAAPCPIDIKRRMIEWFGPIIYEYDSATEAAGRLTIDSHEWLAHPGSVGRAEAGSIVITDEDGAELPTGEDGTIWFTRPETNFSYHGDPEKTAVMFNDKGWARMGDLGHLDEDGYLYLAGRVGHTIISGGVNIYPQEIEDLLIQNPLVDDVAVIGVPDDEFGESVKAVVKLRTGGGNSELEAELIGWTRARLAHFKCPRTVSFVDELPRTEAGKMAKHRLIELFAPTRGR